MKPTIRPMVAEDLDTITDLEQRIFTDAWSKRSFEAELSNKYSFPLVLESEGKIAGYAVVWHIYNEIHIANFAIHPDYRRMGLGKRLMQHILEKFDRADFAFLEVRKSNLPALRLYESFGFKTLNVRKKYYRDGEDALVMVKDLRK